MRLATVGGIRFSRCSPSELRRGDIAVALGSMACFVRVRSVKPLPDGCEVVRGRRFLLRSFRLGPKVKMIVLPGEKFLVGTDLHRT